MDNDAILITGATSGVGLSLSQYLSNRFKVIAIGRNGELLDQLFEGNKKVSCYQVDLSNSDDVENVLAKIIEAYGDIPYLVNNAGVNIKASIEDLDQEKVRYSLQVNAVAPLIILNKILPCMKKNNYGRIINITSGAPLNCYPEFAAYSGSKAALNAYTVTAARECSEYNIKINLMSPGPVRSKMAPDAPMDPSVCHPTVDYLLSLDSDGPTGRFFWLGYEIPLFPDLEGIEWLDGKADQRFKKVI